MNWLAELAQLPDVGSYQFNAATNSYRHLGEEMTMAGSDFSLPPGQLRDEIAAHGVNATWTN
jgi:hypothetical protein